MMGIQRHVRRAVLARLKGGAVLTDLIPAARIYGQTVPATPAWPFVKTGVPQSLPIRATCLVGAVVTMPIDAFAGPRKQGAVTLETAEDHAGRIGEAIETLLHLQGETIDVNGQPARLRYTLSDMRLFLDGAEVDAFHYSALLRARVVAE